MDRGLEDASILPQEVSRRPPVHTTEAPYVAPPRPPPGIWIPAPGPQPGGGHVTPSLFQSGLAAAHSALPDDYSATTGALARKPLVWRLTTALALLLAHA